MALDLYPITGFVDGGIPDFVALVTFLNENKAAAYMSIRIVVSAEFALLHTQWANIRLQHDDRSITSPYSDAVAFTVKPSDLSMMSEARETFTWKLDFTTNELHVSLDNGAARVVKMERLNPEAPLAIPASVANMYFVDETYTPSARSILRLVGGSGDTSATIVGRETRVAFGSPSDDVQIFASVPVTRQSTETRVESRIVEIYKVLTLAKALERYVACAIVVIPPTSIGVQLYADAARTRRRAFMWLETTLEPPRRLPIHSFIDYRDVTVTNRDATVVIERLKDRIKDYCRRQKQFSCFQRDEDGTFANSRRIITNIRGDIDIQLTLVGYAAEYVNWETTVLRLVTALNIILAELELGEGREKMRKSYDASVRNEMRKLETRINNALTRAAAYKIPQHTSLVAQFKNPAEFSPIDLQEAIQTVTRLYGIGVRRDASVNNKVPATRLNFMLDTFNALIADYEAYVELAGVSPPGAPSVEDEIRDDDA